MTLQIPEGSCVLPAHREIGMNGYIFPKRLCIPYRMICTRAHSRGVMPNLFSWCCMRTLQSPEQVENRGECSEPTGLGWAPGLASGLSHFCFSRFQKGRGTPDWCQSIILFYHWNSLLLLFPYLFLCREEKKVFSINLFCSPLFLSLSGFLVLFSVSTPFIPALPPYWVLRRTYPMPSWKRLSPFIRGKSARLGVLVLTSTRIVTSESHFSYEP